jgi:predicted neutral ceramidase superfamily lipid hydrolase
MSEPQSKTLNKVTVNGLAFGKTVLLTLSQAPHGMEDFPETAGSEIVAYANSRGFINAIVVDTHNSEGLKPNEKETKDAIDCSKIIIDSLKDSPQGDFSIGFAHSSEVEGWSSPDVGPAGVGLILFETDNNKRFSLAVSDSNNSALGFREKALRQFQAKAGESVLELCTSDTHVTAAKTATAKGYLALGDVVSPENFSDLLVELNKKARNRMGKASFASEVLDTEVKTIGNEVLRDFSGLLDVASSVAKDGARVLIGLVIVLTVIVALI